MKNLKLIPPVLFFMCSYIVNAQYSRFDLSRYKLPDVKYNRLDAYFNLSNSGRRDQYKPSYTDSTKSSQNYFSGMLNLDYYYFRNTAKYQGEIDASLSGSSSFQKSRNEDSNSDYNNGGFSFYISNINRFYNDNLNFLEIDPLVSLYINNTYNKFAGNTKYDDSNDQSVTSISLPVSVGHGRIEPVEDLRLAIYILEELNKEGIISSLPSDDVVLEMAKEISRIKRQRFFDTRIKKIRELQVVDSFLLANNIISVSDINYFAILNDQWDYASGPLRSAGFAVNAGIDDQLSFDRLHTEISYAGEEPDVTDNDYNTFYIAAFTQARYEKPVNLRWQSSVVAKASYGYEFTRNPQNQENPEENYRTDIFNARIGYSIQFIPDSRTSAQLSLAGNYYNLRGDRTISSIDLDYQMIDNQLTADAGFNMYYYISPQFRLELDSNLSYEILHDLNSIDNLPDVKSLTDSLHHNFRLRLIYSFF